jgi:signal transduction histidine kinase
MMRLLHTGIGNEQDVVGVRQRARQIAGMLGFGVHDQVRIATAVSEVARGALKHVDGGRLTFSVIGGDDGQVLEFVLQEQRASAAGVQGALLDDEAIVTAHRLMDTCVVARDADGALTITLCKGLPAGARIGPADAARIGERLASTAPTTTFAEMQMQNRELVATLAELRARQDDLLELTRELEDTNRGVLALYAEIEEKAERLRRADEMKSRFLSNTSHELRTPLSSIRALTKLLLDRMDGDLTVEQERQVRFIETAAIDLSELVNDLLDLAKIEAGKIEVHPAPVNVANLLSALKGMFRPLAVDPNVELVFETPVAGLQFDSDEGKVAQMLRNFISNALKFTERGEVRVRTEADPDAGVIRFAVSDSGIGIAPEHVALVFEEFGQIENPLQRKVKGTGLGLPLCRKLARLLGGRVELDSVPGAGSTFTLILPLHYRGPADDA